MTFTGLPVILGTADLGAAVSPRVSVAILDAYASLGGSVLPVTTTSKVERLWHLLSDYVKQ